MGLARWLEEEPTVGCSLRLGLVRGFAAPKVAVEVVVGWVVLEEPPALCGVHLQPKVAELTPYVDKNVCSGHRPHKQNKGSLFTN